MLSSALFRKRVAHKFRRYPNILLRIFARFALDRQETAITDFMKRRKIFMPINLSLSERHLLEALARFQCRNAAHGKRMINLCWITLFELYAVFGVRMHDIIFKKLHRFRGILPRHHHEVCGIKIDTHAALGIL